MWASHPEPEAMHASTHKRTAYGPQVLTADRQANDRTETDHPRPRPRRMTQGQDQREDSASTDSIRQRMRPNLELYDLASSALAAL